MNFADYISNAWDIHAAQPSEVANGLPKAIETLANSDEALQIARLVLHVVGEHLGIFELAVQMLTTLSAHSKFEKTPTNVALLTRQLAALKLCEGNREPWEDLPKADQAVALALSATTLLGQTRISEASKNFREAVELASLYLDSKDSGNRNLAVAGNNIASALEEQKELTKDGEGLMIFAAKAGRKYWGIIGNWENIALAEYRLSFSYRKAGFQLAALEHAQECVEICNANNSDPYNLFYGYEAIALAERALNHKIGEKKAFEKMTDLLASMSDENRPEYQARIDREK